MTRDGLDFTIQALITIDQAYPEIPSIFSIESVTEKKDKEDEEMKESAYDVSILLRQIEDELNIHHADYCDHATQGDLLLSF